MKKILKKVIPAVLLIAIGVFAAWWLFHKEEEGPKTQLTLHGNIDIRDVQLAFKERERLVEILVEEGDRVKPGQILARQQTNRLEAQIAEASARVGAQQQVVDRLEAGTRPQEIDQARAEVEAAEVRVKNSQENLERLKKTAGTGAASRQALDDARARADVDQAQCKVKKKALNLAMEGPRKEDIASAKATLKSLEASLSLLEIRLADMVLAAPEAGVVRNRILEPGDMAGPDRPAFTLALTDPKWARAYVPEPSLGLIHLGMKARMQSDSFPDRTFESWIGFISPVAEFTPKTVETTELRTKLVYEVRVYVHDPKDLLRLGMPVTVIVDLASSEAEPGQGAAPPSETTEPDEG